MIFNLAVRFALVGAVALLPLRAVAYAYFTEEALVASFFEGAGADRVEWSPSADQQARFKALVGYPPPKRSYTWLVASEPDTASALPRYALIDEQLGQHEPITFGVLLHADATIERIEVMVYREAYGDGVRAASFREQFHGLLFRNPMRAGKEIRIVSGATISSRALATGARRASALLATWLGLPDPA
jgi:hypothetical protein